ncbi:hypothetical protein [Thermovibrio ammonificans]
MFRFTLFFLLFLLLFSCAPAKKRVEPVSYLPFLGSVDLLDPLNPSAPLKLFSGSVEGAFATYRAGQGSAPHWARLVFVYRGDVYVLNLLKGTAEGMKFNCLNATIADKLVDPLASGAYITDLNGSYLLNVDRGQLAALPASFRFVSFLYPVKEGELLFLALSQRELKLCSLKEKLECFGIASNVLSASLTARARGAGGAQAYALKLNGGTFLLTRSNGKWRLFRSSEPISSLAFSGGRLYAASGGTVFELSGSRLVPVYSLEERGQVKELLPLRSGVVVAFEREGFLFLKFLHGGEVSVFDRRPVVLFCKSLGGKLFYNAYNAKCNLSACLFEPGSGVKCYSSSYWAGYSVTEKGYNLFLVENEDPETCGGGELFTVSQGGEKIVDLGALPDYSTFYVFGVGRWLLGTVTAFSGGRFGKRVVFLDSQTPNSLTFVPGGEGPPVY